MKNEELEIKVVVLFLDEDMAWRHIDYETATKLCQSLLKETLDAETSSACQRKNY